DLEHGSARDLFSAFFARREHEPALGARDGPERDQTERNDGGLHGERSACHQSSSDSPSAAASSTPATAVATRSPSRASSARIGAPAVTPAVTQHGPSTRSAAPA